MPGLTAGKPISVLWAMRLEAVSTEEPSRLVQSLTGAILGCGGWVLSRGASDSGTIHLLFEFERQACLDVYCGLVAAGVELNPTGHRHLTSLCQRSRSHAESRGGEIASVDLEIQTFLAFMAEPGPASGGM